MEDVLYRGFYYLYVSKCVNMLPKMHLVSSYTGCAIKENFILQFIIFYKIPLFCFISLMCALTDHFFYFSLIF